MLSNSLTEVQKFYQDSVIFVTGGTGFLGKLTIEKILRSCPDVRKVYVLVRPKKGLSVEEREKTLLNNVVFDRLKHERPDSLKKIVFVSGDCSAPRLGLTDSDYHDLTQQTNIVLHLAATVRFDEKMKAAINVNIKGTMEVIKLCKGCVSLKAGVFVTTAFSNPNRPLVKEEFYNPPMQIEEITALMGRVTESELEILSHKITGSWKIPYLFSKSVVENTILTHAKDLPVSIVRPSMVLCTEREPLPGWVDNMYGPIAIGTGTGTGVLRLNYADKHAVLDVVPADTVANCIITAALTTNTRSNDAITIYNITSSGTNPVKIKDLLESFYKYGMIFPVRKCIWYPFLITTSSFKMYTFLAIFLHMLPGCLLDLALRLKGKQPKLMKIYRKIRKYAIIINLIPYTEISFTSENTKNLFHKLEPKDKELFFFDVKQINFDSFVETAIVESRKYLLNETLDNLADAKAHKEKLYIIHTVVKFLLCGLAIWTSWLATTFFIPGIF